MNVEIGTEAAQFPGKEYINGIFLAVDRHYSMSDDTRQDGVTNGRPDIPLSTSRVSSRRGFELMSS
jgi:hypothetical protein